MDARLETFDTKMQKSLNNLEEEYSAIRAGRANPHVLDKLKVDYYGTPTPIQSVANVNVPEPRMIQIQPWEASMVKGHREGNPDFRYRNQPVERWKSHPACVSGADRGAQKGSCKRS